MTSYSLKRIAFFVVVRHRMLGCSCSTVVQVTMYVRNASDPPGENIRLLRITHEFAELTQSKIIHHCRSESRFNIILHFCYTSLTWLCPRHETCFGYQKRCSTAETPMQRSHNKLQGYKLPVTCFGWTSLRTTPATVWSASGSNFGRTSTSM